MEKISVYEGKEPYIFISYAHKDTPAVLPILVDLQKKGYRIWYDAGIEAGTEWPEFIAEHLYHCTAFLFFASASALESSNCMQEVNFAVELQKSVAMVYLENVSITPGLRMRVGTSPTFRRSEYATLDAFVDELCSCEAIAPCREADAAASGSEVETFFQKGKDFFYKQQYKAAANWLSKAVAYDHPGAYFLLGRCYDAGNGVEKSFEEAIACYHRAAERGNADAQHALAKHYLYGWGVPKSTENYRKWVKLAAENDHAEAQLDMGADMRDGKNGFGLNVKGGLKWMERSLENATTDMEKGQALCCIAYTYLDHIFSFGHKKKAIEYFRQSARYKWSPAMSYLREHNLSW